jgi:hypothetical protein
MIDRPAPKATAMVTGSGSFAGAVNATQTEHCGEPVSVIKRSFDEQTRYCITNLLN